MARVVLLVVGVLVMLFGFVALASIGIFIFPVGLALVVLSQTLDQPRFAWPFVAATIGLVLGYGLVSPGGCTSNSHATSGGGSRDDGTTTCTSVLGDYRGDGNYDPPLWPGALAALGLGVVGGLGAWLVARWAYPRTEASAEPLSAP